MAKDSIELIRDAERSAQQIIEQAQAQAKKLIADARVQAQTKYDEAIAEAEKSRADAIASAREEGCAAAQSNQSLHKAQCDALRADTAKKRSEAVRLVISDIIGS